jgi:hypothetical protein
MGHPIKKSLFDNDDSAFQAPFVRTDVLSSQYTSIVDSTYQFSLTLSNELRNVG